MAFKFYIDGVLVDQPTGDMGLSTKIRRDDDLGGVVITQDATLTWFKENLLASGEASGYQILTDLFDSGICNEAEIVIQNQVSDALTYLTHTGIIKIPQVEYDEKRMSVSVKIQDNSFYSYIYNNRNLKVDLRAVQTKNKLEIDEIEWYSVDFFNGCTGGFGGVSTGAYYKGYAVTDVLEFIIAVITDNKVGFQSDYLTNLTYPLFLFKGESLVAPYTIYPGSNPVFEISLQEIITELDRLKNLYFYIDASTPDSPVFRLESREETFSQQTTVTLSEPLEIQTKVDTGTLYTKVVTGSTINADGSLPCSSGGWYTMNEAISYYGFKVEEFFPLGQCNTGTELNLTNQWIISNNVIQDIVVGGSASYLDNYVLVECDGVDTGLLTANAFPWDFYGQTTPPFLYNLGLNNYAKMQRHSSKFETIFGNFLGGGALTFKALQGDNPSQDVTYSTITGTNIIPPGGITVTPVGFVNETTNGGFDGSNNYDNVTEEYTVSVDGDYSFHFHLHIETTDLEQNPFEWYIVTGTINHYDSGMALKGTITTTMNIYNSGFFFLDGTYVANCVTGDILKFEQYTIEYTNNFPANLKRPTTITVIWDSFFECNGDPEGGITITTGNASIRKLIHEFQYHIADSDWALIIANPTGMIPFIKDEVERYGWIQEMSRNDQTGLTEIKLLSSNATA